VKYIFKRGERWY